MDHDGHRGELFLDVLVIGLEKLGVSLDHPLSLEERSAQRT